MNCRGVNTRIKIVEQYDIKLIARTRLLNGQIERSDAEAKLTDQYYVFQCTAKNDDRIVKSQIKAIIKEYDFDLLRSRLSEEDIESYF